MIEIGWALPSVLVGYLVLGLVVMFAPVLWLVLSSLKSESAIGQFPPTFWPLVQKTVTVEGRAQALPQRGRRHTGPGPTPSRPACWPCGGSRCGWTPAPPSRSWAWTGRPTRWHCARARPGGWRSGRGLCRPSDREKSLHPQGLDRVSAMARWQPWRTRVCPGSRPAGG